MMTCISRHISAVPLARVLYGTVTQKSIIIRFDLIVNRGPKVFDTVHQIIMRLQWEPSWSLCLQLSELWLPKGVSGGAKPPAWRLSPEKATACYHTPPTVVFNTVLHMSQSATCILIIYGGSVPYR
jgi:hypothetical protein